MASGLPLRGNPAVAALMDLLRLAAPGGGATETRKTAYPWRQTVEAWRSPYLNLSETHAGATFQDAQALDRVARWGSVVGGLEQWREAFALLEETLGQERPEALDEDMPPVREVLPTAEAARALAERFERFVARITPPEGDQSCSTFVRWIEALIGDEAPPESGPASDRQAASLGIAQAVARGAARTGRARPGSADRAQGRAARAGVGRGGAGLRAGALFGVPGRPAGRDPHDDLPAAHARRSGGRAGSRRDPGAGRVLPGRGRAGAGRRRVSHGAGRGPVFARQPTGGGCETTTIWPWTSLPRARKRLTFTRQ